MTVTILNPAMVGPLLLMLGFNIGMATKFLLDRNRAVACFWLIANLFAFGKVLVLQ